MRTRTRVESVLAGLSGLLGVLTLVWRDWIEAVTGWDPDRHNGSVETTLVAVLLTVALITSAHVIIGRRRAAVPGETG